MTQTVEPVDNRTVPELLEEWAAIMRALKARDVIRTNNNPTGDYAEAIVAEHFGGKRGSFAQKGWDVVTTEGDRIQVKSMRTTTTTKRRNFSPIRDQEYDVVVIVIFDENFRVTEGLRFNREVVEDLFATNDYVNGVVIKMTAGLRNDPRVETLDLADAAARLGS